MSADVHRGQPILRGGAAMEAASAAVVLLHGRGGDAAEMLDLARALAGPGVACVAPQAAGRVWYPRRFVEPVEANEPDLSSALALVGALIAELSASLPASRIALAGFSQGACLALEFSRRHGGVGCVLGFSGGLIGATAGSPGDPRALDQVPVLLGCSERDPHIPLTRVHETATVLRAMGAAVTMRIAPGAGHAVTPAEAAIARDMLGRLAA